MKNLAWLLSASALLVGACDSSDDGNNGGEITSAEYDDVARSVGGSTARNGGDTGAMGDLVIVAYGELPLGFSLGVDGHINGVAGGLSYDFALTCQDLDGTQLALCDETTNSAEVDLAWSGELDLPNFSTAVSREGSWSIDGLQTDTATFEGAGTFAYDASITNPASDTTYDYSLDYAASYDAVLIDTETTLAVGGGIHYDIAAEKQVDGDTTRSFSISADLELHADGTATLLLDGTYEYTLDLETGAVVRI